MIDTMSGDAKTKNVNPKDAVKLELMRKRDRKKLRKMKSANFEIATQSKALWEECRRFVECCLLSLLFGLLCIMPVDGNEQCCHLSVSVCPSVCFMPVVQKLFYSYYIHAHPFNPSRSSGTTRVSRYQKCKTNLHFTEARDSEWHWHQLGRMQVCTSLQRDNHTGTSPLSFYRPGVLPATQPTASKH